MKKWIILHLISIFLVFTLLSLVSGQGNVNFIKRDVALQAINASEKVIQEMQINNFSINYVNDSLIEAKRVFEQVSYAEILRSATSTEKEKQGARQALRLVNWQNITFSNVLFYTEEIKNREKTAFLLVDEINVARSKISGLSNATITIFDQAKIAFSQERYNDAQKLLEDFNAAVEKEKAENSFITGIKNGALNFFQRYWISLIISLVAIWFLGHLVYKKFEKRFLKNRIKKINIEEHVLTSLMKRTQEERFKENSISGLVYNIRMKKYGERQQEIKEELPALEDRLKKA